MVKGSRAGAATASRETSLLLEVLAHTFEERENVHKESKEEGSRSEKREVEEDMERVETSSKRICVDRLDNLHVGKRVFEPFGSSSQVENVGIAVDFSLCVLALPPVVLMVTVLFSDVNLGF